MRPYEGGGDDWIANELKELENMDEQERAYEAQKKARQAVREILGDDKKWPRELIFIGRNMRIVQGNNQFLGSPVNRIKITGTWASRALVEESGLPFREKMINLGRHIIFRCVLLSTDVVFYFSKLKQMLGLGRGMEDEIEQQMKHMAKDFGVDLNHGVFEG